MPTRRDELRHLASMAGHCIAMLSEMLQGPPEMHSSPLFKTLADVYVNEATEAVEELAKKLREE